MGSNLYNCSFDTVQILPPLLWLFLSLQIVIHIPLSCPIVTHCKPKQSKQHISTHSLWKTAENWSVFHLNQHKPPHFPKLTFPHSGKMGKKRTYPHFFVKIHTRSREKDINSCFINISVDKFVCANNKAIHCLIHVDNYVPYVQNPSMPDITSIIHISTALVMVFLKKYLILFNINYRLLSNFMFLKKNYHVNFSYIPIF